MSTESDSDLFFDTFKMISFLCGQKAEVPDPHKASGQDMLEEPADKLKGIEKTGLERFFVLLSIPKSHPAVLTAQDIPVRDGTAVKVRGQMGWISSTWIDGIQLTFHD